jgi:toxic protein SymE
MKTCRQRLGFAFGGWLEAAGFEIAGRIRVEVERGKLIITPV